MTWRRLEATSVDAALVESTEARVADPYWLLGKQWQVGELTGDDAASPVLVECDVEYTPVTRFQAGPPESHGPVIDRAALGVPLETAVEREDVRDGPAAARLSAEAGLQLLRLLEAAGAPATARAALRAAFPLRLPDDDGLDPLGRAQLELLARRSFDSAALAQRLAGGRPAVPGLDRPALRSAVTAWSSWYASLFSEPPSGTVSWQPERMGYRFRVAASPQKQGEVLLDAAEYDGGSLDWYAFDVREDLPALGAPAAIEQRHVRVAPTPARYAGQAASRWWQVEDVDVWFGDLHTGSTDLARAAVGVYGASFGDDWFLVPVRLPAGVLARVDTLTVHDTFGETHRIRSCAELDGPGRVWRYFELTGDASADADNLKGRTCPWLFLPPVLPSITESRPLEEVVFLRDEGANLGWAAELRVESQAGRPIARAPLARAARQPSPTAVEGAWLYLVSTPVLDHQIPLVPVRLPDGSLSLQRGRIATGVAGAEVTTRGALGRILEPGEVLLVDDGEVPATGMRVTRTWQVARTGDGGIVCWVGRRKTPAPPRHAPGLVFDQVSR